MVRARIPRRHAYARIVIRVTVFWRVVLGCVQSCTVGWQIMWVGFAPLAVPSPTFDAAVDARDGLVLWCVLAGWGGMGGASLFVDMSLFIDDCGEIAYAVETGRVHRSGASTGSSR